MMQKEVCLAKKKDGTRFDVWFNLIFIIFFKTMFVHKTPDS